jgi:hypothetical protein
LITAAIKSPAALQEYTMRELGELARKVGVDNWRSMRKDQLIRSLVRAASKRSEPVSKRSEPASKRREPAPKSKGAKTAAPKAAAKSPSRRSAKAPARPVAKAQRSKPTAKSPSQAKRVAKPPKKSAPKTSPRVSRRIQALNDKREHRMDLSKTAIRKTAIRKTAIRKTAAPWIATASCCSYATRIGCKPAGI